MGQVPLPLEGISAGDSDIERSNIAEVTNIDHVKEKTNPAALGESTAAITDTTDIALNIEALDPAFQLSECLRSNSIEVLRV
ncbi:hypothetical protein CFIO01_13282 [Colletotrichum fioriniae PJ7]|uniref:Uncharacterized protein n=1 Tax=Colletotrichum fioriniae PJ7 TaxID=1445577 RepID=A0A010RZY5_9PEZI|nr:hypothetical protein CFIO01_13282 [Colletotrichum fioriniae PJ7]